MSEQQAPEHQIVLFVKAGSDRECIGCCPFSQGLFMMLWLKGSVFNVTTVDKDSKPKELADIAPGTSTPFILFDNEVVTDPPRIVEFLEAQLQPPKYPGLMPVNPESHLAGFEIFAKFSAWIKAKFDSPNYDTLEKRFLTHLAKFDAFLKMNTDRRFIDGNTMTAVDCNILPKLHIAIVVAKALRQLDICSQYTGIAQYMANASQHAEFSQTCAHNDEIIWSYGGPKPKLKN